MPIFQRERLLISIRLPTASKITLILSSGDTRKVGMAIEGIKAAALGKIILAYNLMPK